MSDLLNERKAYESADLVGQIQRVEYLLENNTSPQAHELGILLALRLALEIKQGKAPGTDTGVLVASWAEEHPGSTVDEAIAYARELLLKPAEMSSRIGEKLFAGKKGTL